MSGAEAESCLLSQWNLDWTPTPSRTLNPIFRVTLSRTLVYEHIIGDLVTSSCHTLAGSHFCYPCFPVEETEATELGGVVTRILGNSSSDFSKTASGAPPTQQSDSTCTRYPQLMTRPLETTPLPRTPPPADISGLGSGHRAQAARSCAGPALCPRRPGSRGPPAARTAASRPWCSACGPRRPGP